ncbi:MAG: orotidine-5'-phosphate decarboxylase [Ignavibacteriales bacterium]|nr:MAG: orotidine-5'-phosphate decarboxylase [Ignavibacteriales bacterium]
MTAKEKLQSKNAEGKFICVGLDSDIEKIPEHLKQLDNPLLEFNKSIIDSTREHAAAYKLNFAFYERDGAKGFENLYQTIKHIPEDILIIGDAKRGDIGNTSQMYAKSSFEYFGCDACTVNPYMGEDSVAPFASFPDKLVFVLSLTSNPSSAEFEKQKLYDGTMLFQKVIQRIHKWGNTDSYGVVFGATNSKELKDNIGILKQLPLLIPGIGTQGGSLEDIVKILRFTEYPNYLLNISRSLIYKDSSENFAGAVTEEIIQLNRTIDRIMRS